MTDHLAKRIKSFVIRAGRMTESQQKGWTTGFPLHGFQLGDKNFDWDQSFNVAGPVAIIPLCPYPLLLAVNAVHNGLNDRYVRDKSCEVLIGRNELLLASHGNWFAGVLRWTWSQPAAKRSYSIAICGQCQKIEADEHRRNGIRADQQWNLPAFNRAVK